MLGNLLRTRRYGAQESRTGTMTNHCVGLAFCDAEVFSNLYFTQAIHDALKQKASSRISIEKIQREAAVVAENLLNREPVRISRMLFDRELAALLEEVTDIYRSEARLRAILTALCQQTQTYAYTFGAWAGQREES